MCKSKEEWNLLHPEDQIPEYLGLDGRLIPERYIPYKDVIKGDILVSEGEMIMLVDGGFVLFNNNPSLYFLSTPIKKWEKLNVC